MKPDKGMSDNSQKALDVRSVKMEKLKVTYFQKSRTNSANCLIAGGRTLLGLSPG